MRMHAVHERASASACAWGMGDACVRVRVRGRRVRTLHKGKKLVCILVLTLGE